MQAWARPARAGRQLWNQVGWRNYSSSAWPVVQRLGDSAVVARFGPGISPEANDAALALMKRLDKEKEGKFLDLIPGYASLTMLYDPLEQSYADLEADLQEAAETAARECTSRNGSAQEAARIVDIPVRYGGESGPDLAEVAALTGMSEQEVRKLHTSALYRVYFLGFLAGFPYLGGLPRELAQVPRLDTPRAVTPKGSVALAAGQTGVYTVASPGGWRVLGNTNKSLFDPHQDPPALLRAGDRVRFVDTTDAGDGSSGGPGYDDAAEPTKALVADKEARPWATLESPGPLTLVQDLGRLGYGRHGVSRSGAADELALRMGNALLQNDPGAAALEVAMGGVILRASEAVAVAVTGADCNATAAGDPLRPNTVVELRPGQTLELKGAVDGIRSYICVSGGVESPAVLGSHSVDARSGLGGAALQAGQELLRGTQTHPNGALAGRVSAVDPMRSRVAGEPTVLRVVPGPGTPESSSPGLDARQAELLSAGVFTVDPRSDRMGVRLKWEDAEANGAGGVGRPVGGQTLSEGVARGAVQLPPDGAPILLLADHQATGGYCVPAVVASADMWRVAQLRPGDDVRLQLVTHEEATAAIRELHEGVERINRQAGASLMDPTVLRQGFKEYWDGDSH